MYPEYFIIHKLELQVRKWRLGKRFIILLKATEFVNDGAQVLTQVLQLQIILFFKVWCWDHHPYNQNLCNRVQNPTSLPTSSGGFWALHHSSAFQPSTRERYFVIFPEMANVKTSIELKNPSVSFRVLHKAGSRKIPKYSPAGGEIHLYEKSHKVQAGTGLQQMLPFSHLKVSVCM